MNPLNRAESLQFYTDHYLPYQAATIEWNGDHASCNAGSTGQAFRDAIAARINYFRAMAGVPADIVLSDEFNRKAQAAALMMSVNRKLSHAPDASWRCYTAEGAEAAGSSNLFLGVNSVKAIDGYIDDPGDNNSAVGHRRWLLYPQTTQMGTGDIPGQGSDFLLSNALWVFDGNFGKDRPATREEYVAWPPPGYVPADLVFDRWSFSYPDADFDNATVSMQTLVVNQASGEIVQSSSGMEVMAAQPLSSGYGENTMVWEPANTSGLGQPGQADTGFSVTIDNVLIDGVARSFSYSVVAFDPAADPPPPATNFVYLPVTRK